MQSSGRLPSVKKYADRQGVDIYSASQSQNGALSKVSVTTGPVSYAWSPVTPASADVTMASVEPSLSEQVGTVCIEGEK